MPQEYPDCPTALILSHSENCGSSEIAQTPRVGASKMAVQPSLCHLIARRELSATQHTGVNGVREGLRRGSGILTPL